MEHSSLWISTVILNICTSQMVVLESFAGEHCYSIYWKIAPSELEFGPSCLAFPVDRGVCVQAVIGPCLSNASGVSLEGRSAPLTPTLAVLVILTVSAHTSQPVLTRSGSSWGPRASLFPEEQDPLRWLQGRKHTTSLLGHTSWRCRCTERHWCERFLFSYLDFTCQ